VGIVVVEVVSCTLASSPSTGPLDWVVARRRCVSGVALIMMCGSCIEGDEVTRSIKR
jgi:hypothetical protein